MFLIIYVPFLWLHAYDFDFAQRGGTKKAAGNKPAVFYQ
jgi:hypothetical protein